MNWNIAEASSTEIVTMDANYLLNASPHSVIQKVNK